MATIGFYPLDVTYKVVDDVTHTYLFGRTTDNRQIAVVDTNSLPYFYIVPRDNTVINDIAGKVKNLRVENRGYVASVKKVETAEGTYKGRKINAIKVSVNRPRSLSGIHDAVKQLPGVQAVLEADIPYKRKYWIDKQINPLVLLHLEGDFTNERMKVPVFRANKIERGDTSLERLKILAFDIETYNPLGKTVMPEKFPILMISFYGDDGFKRVITWKRFKTDQKYIEFVDGEAELITRFKETLEEYAPDAIVGYYSDGFDLPYIMTRAEKYKIKLDIGLDNSTPRLGRGFRKSVETTGLIHIDVFNFIKQISRSLETETLKLNDVAEELLGEKKDDVEIERLAEVWDAGSEELETFCKYNLKDSELTHKLLRKLLPNIKELMKLIGQPLQAVERMGYGQLVEWYLMKRSIEFKQFIPKRPAHNEIEKRMYERAKGGFVFEPQPGLYKDLFLFDFRSLYPTIIIIHNISPETINCTCCMDTEKVPLEKKQLWFCKKRKGFFSTILDDVVTRRMRINAILKTVDEEKKILLKARQESLKILANSFYGYLGFFGARWYSKECTEAVTAYGRHYIHQVIDKAKEAGLKVVYSDTDSIFLGLDGKTAEDVKKFGEKVNYELPELMELEFEGHYKTGLFVATKEMHGAKKKYALLSGKNQIIIKGFETIRRNWSFIAKDIQEKVLKLVLKEQNPEKALAFVKKQIGKIRKKELPVGDVVIQTQLTKPIASYDAIGPHVAVAKLMQARGDTVNPGDIMRYVIIEGTGKIRDRARLPEEVKKEDYDADYYVNNQIIPSVDSIFEVFGHSKEELAEEKEQSKLDSFFG
ncbi:DNA-directed DNA polymerase [Thermoproteota archaeon]